MTDSADEKAEEKAIIVDVSDDCCVEATTEDTALDATLDTDAMEDDDVFCEAENEDFDVVEATEIKLTDEREDTTAGTQSALLTQSSAPRPATSTHAKFWHSVCVC